MSDIIEKFDAAMFDIYKRAKSEVRYTAVIFLRMLNDKGGLVTAKALINASNPSSGYTHLFERSRLDLTVEALVVEDERWRELFTPAEIERARTRLIAYKYQPRTR